MRKTSIITSCALMATFSLLAASASAETLEACMKRKAIEAAPSIHRDIFTDQGCNTKKTDWDGERHSCRDTLCWSTPPNHIITDSSAHNASSNGSEYGFTGPHYEPTRDAATKVCYKVHARSPEGLGQEKGWMKIDATAVIKKVPDSGEWLTFARECLEEGAS